MTGAFVAVFWLEMVVFDGYVFDVDFVKGALIVASYWLDETIQPKRLKRDDEYATWQLIVLNQ